MQTLTVYKIERETDPAWKYTIDMFEERTLWKVFYKRGEKSGGVAWADGTDELSAFANFKKARLNSDTVIEDKFIVKLGSET